MTINITSTDMIVEVKNGTEGIPVPGRVWEGTTDKGVDVICVITRVAVKMGQDVSVFERDLKEHKPPSIDAMQAIPLRMIL